MKKEKEFFDEVEEVLHAYTETYEEGAWEDFEAHRRLHKKILLFRPWAAVAAAVLLLGVYVIFELNKPAKVKEHTIVKKTDHQILKQPANNVAKDTINNKNEVDLAQILLAKQLKENARPIQSTKSNSDELTKDSIPNAHQQQFLNETIIVHASKEDEAKSGSVNSAVVGDKIANSGVAVGKVANNGVERNSKLNTLNPVSAGAYDSLLHKNNLTKVAKNEERNFTYSVVVSPSLSNQKINFGAGMEVSYKLGSRFSINSGLIYNELSAKSNGKSLASASSYAYGQDASLALSGIEIPIGLQYQINNGFYASVGISGMGLLHNKLEYSYQESRVASMPVANSGGADDVIKLVSEQKTAQAKEDLNNYIGFFTISAGKKQAFGNSRLNIGPFLKVPFNSVSSEKIKLVQGGFRLSFDF